MGSFTQRSVTDPGRDDFALQVFSDDPHTNRGPRGSYTLGFIHRPAILVYPLLLRHATCFNLQLAGLRGNQTAPNRGKNAYENEVSFDVGGFEQHSVVAPRII